ncbi:FKBP-type peptidyl-prolyl cis-trans isomerase [Chitinophaga sp. Hz27]|uniref:FKBP-type peptidyl-prolyl cis-trans isomerase n=1 Tax=Chitinophaga sp. Hz27 TaxID=3347169 RepID=UPI0035DCF890
MNKLLLIFSILLLSLSACTKSDDGVLRQLESAQRASDSTIQNYLTAHNETGTIRDPSGLYYKIYFVGDSIHFPALTSVVTVNYTYQLLDGTIVASSMGVTNFRGIQLNKHILAWQIGLLKISTGGRMRMYIPPTLAFGESGIPNQVPANATLICDVELVSFK